MHEPEAKKLIYDAFLHKFGARLGLKKLSINEGSLSKNIQAVDNEDWSKALYLLDIKYRKDTKTRLWEVTYTHNWDITIPEDMYPLALWHCICVRV